MNTHMVAVLAMVGGGGGDTEDAVALELRRLDVYFIRQFARMR